MTKLLCIATCYMPLEKGKKLVDRFEDEYDDERDVYEVPNNLVKSYLESGNFEPIAEQG